MYSKLILLDQILEKIPKVNFIRPALPKYIIIILIYTYFCIRYYTMTESKTCFTNNNIVISITIIYVFTLIILLLSNVDLEMNKIKCIYYVII